MQGVLKIAVLMMVLGGLTLIPSCKKDEILPFNLASLIVNGVDLRDNSPVGVPISSVFIATFSADVDPNSLSFSSVTMTRVYDTANVSLTLILNKRTLSIRPTSDLIYGATYTLAISSTLRSTGGLSLSGFGGSFKTIGTFVPPGEIAYWSFEGIPDDVIGSHNPLTADDALITYVPRTNAPSTLAAGFDGRTSIEQILGGAALLTPEFTITFWMFLNSDDHTDVNGVQKGSFVFGIGNGHGLQFDVDADYNWCRISHGLLLTDGTTTTTDFQFFADGLTRDNVSGSPYDSIKQGIDNYTTVNQNIGEVGLKSKLDKTWAQIAFSFNDSTKTRALYINGELMYQQTFTLADSNVVAPALRPLLKASSLKFVPDTNIPPTFDDMLAFGFRQGKDALFGAPAQDYANPDANHFHGLLDDIRIFKRSLTDREISFIYEDEKPIP